MNLNFNTVYRDCPWCRRRIRVEVRRNDLDDVNLTPVNAFLFSEPSGGELRPMRAEDRARNQIPGNVAQMEFQIPQPVDLTGAGETSTYLTGAEHLRVAELSLADRRFIALGRRQRADMIFDAYDENERTRLQRLDREHPPRP